MEIILNPVTTYNLVFDIDNVLADTTVREAKEIKFFKEKGFVLTAIKTHYIFPGVIEMMQLLFRMPDVRVSFFSSGHQSRNEMFVEKLLEKALGKERYLEVKASVRILSGKKSDGETDLSLNNPEDSKAQWLKYGLHHGNKKKSVEKIAGPGNSLDNCVLIDDELSWIKRGEENNFLYSPASYTRNFFDLEGSREFHTFDSHGFMRIPFSDYSHSCNHEYMKTCVLQSKHISLIFEENTGRVFYSDLSQTKVEELEISLESTKDLFIALRKYYHGLISKKDGEPKLSEEEAREILYNLIAQKNGKISKINLECNRICYVAGVLFKGLEQARNGVPLTQYLFPLHFTPKKDSDTFVPRFTSDECYHEREELYLYGLNVLRQANPHFAFITTQIYTEACNKSITPEEELENETLFKNQDGCTIM